MERVLELHGRVTVNWSRCGGETRSKREAGGVSQGSVVCAFPANEFNCRTLHLGTLHDFNS